MEIEAAVAEGAVAGVMPVFADVLYVIEPAGIFDGGVEPGRAHDLFVGLFCIFDIVCSHLVIRVGVHASVDLVIEFSVLK